MENDGFGGSSVMVWSGIAYGLKTPLVVVNGDLNAIQYRDRILVSACSFCAATQSDTPTR